MNSRSVGTAEKHIRQTLGAVYGEREASGMARIILEHLTGNKRIHLPARRTGVLSNEQLLSLERILNEIKAGRPVQYVLGETEFYGLKLKVDASVLIPRQETEELADWIIKDNRSALSQGASAGKGSCDKDAAYTEGAPYAAGGRGAPRILDIGTGSGCIAIALKKNLPQAEVWSCDVSSPALDIAAENAAINGADVIFREADILDSRQWRDFPSFDIIVSNPPYVTVAEKQDMAGHVLQHEPHLALFVENKDPLLFYRLIAAFARKKLRPGGKLYFEINEAYGKETLALLREEEFLRAQLRKDLNGRDRMIRAVLAEAQAS